MSNETYTDDFYEDDDLYYDELEYEDYDEYDDLNESDKTIEYDTVDYDRDDYGEYDNSTYDYDDTTEEYEEKKKSNIVTILKKIFLVILLILFILLLFMFFKSTRNNHKSTNNVNELKIINKVDNNNSEIFEKMKNASLEYFTKERVDADETSVKLSKMEELNLISGVDSKYDKDKSVATLKDNVLKIVVYNNGKESAKSYAVGNYVYCKETYYCVKSATLENKSYEYEKEGERHILDWSSWTDYEETSCDTTNIECDKNDYNCLTEVKTTYKYNYNTKKMVYQVSRNAFSTIQKEVLSVCSNYDYIKINNAYYRTEKDSNFKVLGLINKNTKSDYYNWKYNGRKKYHNPPSDTINTRYVFVEEDYSNCGDSCSDHPDYYYDSYTFTKQLVNVSSIVGDCNTYATKVVPNYVIENQKITVSRDEKQDSKICYKSIRERKVNQDEKITQWSNYNNKKLLEDGYNYTGQYK